MSRVHLTDAGEVARRRKLAPPGRLLEAWPDLYTAGHAWVGEEARRLLEDAAGGLVVLLPGEAAGAGDGVGSGFGGACSACDEHEHEYEHEHERGAHRLRL